MSTRSHVMPIGWMFGRDVATATGPDPSSPEGPGPKGRGPEGCAIYCAGSLYEAQLVLDLLAEAGISARLFNEHLIGAMGELPLLESSPKIWLLDQANIAAARTVIDGYEARRRVAVSGTLICEACGEDSPGNFELCWSCRAPLSDD